MFRSVTFRKLALLLSLSLGVTAGFLLAAPTTDATGCGTCTGPVQTSYGSDVGTTCTAARQAAEARAIASAFPPGNTCIPCQASVTSSCRSDPLCYLDGNGECFFIATATYTYRCQSGCGGPL